MKKNICVLFFSPTGSCKKIAEAIAQALKNDYVTIIDITPPELRKTCRVPLNCDCLIAVLPVYAQDLPDCVAEYLSGLKGNAAPAIIISVYGNVHSGRALYHVTKLMSNNGFKILSGVVCPASHSYNHEGLSIASGYPDNKAIMQISHFVEASLKKLNLDTCSYLNPCVLRKYKNILAYLPQKLLAQLTVKKPEREKALCIRCNKCISACPVSAIDTSLEIDNKKCIRCCACVKTCKQMARRIVFTSPLPYFYLSNRGKKKRDLRFYKAIP